MECPVSLMAYSTFTFLKPFYIFTLQYYDYCCIHFVMTELAMELSYTEWEAALIAAVCGLIVVGTIVGNVLVCTAVAIVRRLRTPSNLLIVSLAVSDLLVAVLVMPLAVAYEVMGRWSYGQHVCDMWTSLDVMLCTASILNLCAISIDRLVA